MKTSALLLISILLVGRFTALGVTLPAAEDSYGFRAKISSVANKATVLPVDITHRAFLYFDLANELPANTQIRYARLRIYLPKVTRAGEGIAVHQVTSTWDESLASSEPTFTATPFTSFPPSGMGTKRFVSVDVTNVVQSWIATPATNEGFAITAIPGATAKLTASVSLVAKEGAGSGYPAELDIEIATDRVADGGISSAQLASGLTLGGTTTGTFTGNGTGLTNVNADMLDGLDALAFAPANGSAVYLAKVGGTMTGSLALPINGLNVGGNQFVVAGGSVGIGTTTTPSAKLDVNGSIALTGALRVPGAGVGTNGTAFIHATTAGNVLSVIDHPLCNGDPTAMLIITHQVVADLNTPSNLHNHPVGVHYNVNNSRWYIFNEDFAFMPAGVKFNVLVIKP